MSLAATKAQDKIITVNKDTIECRIISVGGERINYEQKTSENHVIGKSIAISDVYQYFRAGQPGALNSFDRPKTTRQKPERRYLLTIQGGLARSFTDFDNFKNLMTGSGATKSETDSYIGKLKNGYHLNAGFHYLMTTFLGVGADYTLFYSASEGNFLINGYGGMISMVNLTNYSTTKTYELDLTVYDVEWANDGWFCYTQANSSKSSLFWINANNDETYETVLSNRSLGTVSLKKVPNQPYIIASPIILRLRQPFTSLKTTIIP